MEDKNKIMQLKLKTRVSMEVKIGIDAKDHLAKIKPYQRMIGSKVSSIYMRIKLQSYPGSARRHYY